jgi:hypothetical protein
MKITIIILSIALIITLNSCYSVKEISTFKNLADARARGEIQIVTIDTTVYYVDNFTYSDSSINIKGIKKKSDLQSDYNGNLEFKDIVYIQSVNSNTLQNLAFLGINVFLIANGVSMLSDPAEVEAIVKFPSGGGSCPYIYSWNGNNYNLEGESFGTAFGKALETETSIIMRNLTPSDNKIKVKLSNERPETHFFNNIQLVAVQTNKDETVYADNRNSLCSVKKHKKIFKAMDRNKTEVTDLLMNDDNTYWKSDLSSAVPSLNFEDQLIIELNDIDQEDSLSLVVSAINSEISSVVFSYLQKLLGDEFINFTRAAETDPEIIEILNKTLYRSSLKIDVWTGTAWEYADFVYPEANKVEFNKLVRLPVIKNDNDVMKIRLRCLSDVWKIDALHFDDSPINKLIMHQPKLLYYRSDVQNDLNYITKKDDLYTKLLPGQSIELEYEVVQAPSDKKITYAITSGGYLYEWIIDNSLINSDGIKNLNVFTPKIKLVKEMLKNIDSILPIIYSDWRDIKNKLVVNEL